MRGILLPLMRQSERKREGGEREKRERKRKRWGVEWKKVLKRYIESVSEQGRGLSAFKSNIRQYSVVSSTGKLHLLCLCVSVLMRMLCF